MGAVTGEGTLLSTVVAGRLFMRPNITIARTIITTATTIAVMTLLRFMSALRELAKLGDNASPSQWLQK